MKIFVYILIALAGILVIYNTTKIDFNNLFAGESTIAFICILAGICAMLLLTILLISKKIEAKSKN